MVSIAVERLYYDITGNPSNGELDPVDVYVGFVKLYTTLGIKPGANAKEIKEAFRTTIKKWHPDLSMHLEEKYEDDPEIKTLIDVIEEGCKDLTHAYEILSNDDKREIIESFIREAPREIVNSINNNQMDLTYYNRVYLNTLNQRLGLGLPPYEINRLSEASPHEVATALARALGSVWQRLQSRLEEKTQRERDLMQTIMSLEERLRAARRPKPRADDEFAEL